VFSVLDIKEMRMAEGAMREGLLYDMLGPLPARGCARAHRARHAAALSRRHRAGRGVEATVRNFLEQTRRPGTWKSRWAHLALKWAARLHEIGLDVSHSGYHRHGAYLELKNADMPGKLSARNEQLAARASGRPLTAASSSLEAWKSWGAAVGSHALHLIVLLRLAVLLHRGRSTTALAGA